MLARGLYVVMTFERLFGIEVRGLASEKWGCYEEGVQAHGLGFGEWRLEALRSWCHLSIYVRVCVCVWKNMLLQLLSWLSQ